MFFKWRRSNLTPMLSPAFHAFQGSGGIEHPFWMNILNRLISTVLADIGRRFVNKAAHCGEQSKMWFLGSWTIVECWPFGRVGLNACMLTISGSKNSIKEKADNVCVPCVSFAFSFVKSPIPFPVKLRQTRWHSRNNLFPFILLSCV